MTYFWWATRALTGTAIGAVLGSVGGAWAFVAMGAALGFAFGLGFPDRQQRRTAFYHLNPDRAHWDGQDASLWQPSARSLPRRL